MRGRWWRWLSAVLAVICGLAFGWVAGTGLVQAAPTVGGTAGATHVQLRCCANQSSSRFQPSSASALR